MSPIEYANDCVIPAAFQMLPGKMRSRPARALLITIGMQESLFEYRAQVGGPARSFWQFEVTGVKGVLAHKSSATLIAAILKTLDYYDSTPSEIHAAIQHNDILACAFARLLLWTSPKNLPLREDAAEAWNLYISCWRPGKPHRETWDGYYSRAWELVEPTT